MYEQACYVVPASASTIGRRPRTRTKPSANVELISNSYSHDRIATQQTYQKRMQCTEDNMKQRALNFGADNVHDAANFVKALQRLHAKIVEARGCTSFALVAV